MTTTLEFVGEETSGMDIAPVLEGRAAFYETLAALYFKPLTQEQVDTMASADFSSYSGINEEFDIGIKKVTTYLSQRNSGTRQELAIDFTSAFAGTKAYKGKSAVPYKSVFTSDEGLMYREGYHEVFAAFKKEAVKKRDGLDYPDDHLSFMCEFMALLSRRISKSLVAGDISQAKKDIITSQEFLSTHIVTWFDAFIMLASRILKTEFYLGVLQMSKGFFMLDKEALDDLFLEIDR